MDKIQSRPENFKVKKYLNFERLNLKSHIYNEVVKTEKIYKQLNSTERPTI